MNNLKCAGCGKGGNEVRRLVSLRGNARICNECVDLCSEIVHDGDNGMVRIAASELERLRESAHEAVIARIWIDCIRRSMREADAALPPHFLPGGHAASD